MELVNYFAELLVLTTDRSQVEDLVLSSAELERRRGLSAPVRSFTYEPAALRRFPLSQSGYSFDWPLLVLTCDEGGRNDPEVMLRRRRIEISGTELAFVDLAQIFLDAGRPGQGADELDLECFDQGNGGVRVGSCELKVWLPGSIGYEAPRRG